MSNISKTSRYFLFSNFYLKLFYVLLIKNILGVLTGVGTEADLTHADLIVDDVTQVVDLITPSEEKTREWHSVQVHIIPC